MQSDVQSLVEIGAREVFKVTIDGSKTRSERFRALSAKHIGIHPDLYYAFPDNHDPIQDRVVVTVEKWHQRKETPLAEITNYRREVDVEQPWASIDTFIACLESDFTPGQPVAWATLAEARYNELLVVLCVDGLLRIVEIESDQYYGEFDFPPNTWLFIEALNRS